MPDGASAPPILAYVPRAPAATLLHRVVESAMPDFLRAAAPRFPSGEVPRFVRKELEGYLGCGDFARFRCDACRFERLVAFSCKTRGFCPSCGAKRMTRMAAHLVDRVFPHVPVRQWVLTIPFALRAKLAFDHAFAREILRALVAAIAKVSRARARETTGHAGGRHGAVTAIQRFGSGLNLHVHFHSLVLDGVFVHDNFGNLEFVEGRTWSGNAIGEVLIALVDRLHRRGVIAFDDVPEGLAVPLDDLRSASIAHRIALGPRRGQRVERIGTRLDKTGRSCSRSSLRGPTGRRTSRSRPSSSSKSSRRSFHAPMRTFFSTMGSS